jgi:YesN/AraC family two-component response regulator
MYNKDTGINHFYDLKFHVPEQKIDFELFIRLLELNPDRALLDYDPKNYDNWQHLDKITLIEKGETIQNLTETRGILLHLFSRFLISAKSNLHIENKSHKSIFESIQYINENLDHDLDLDTLAEKAYLSKDYYSRLFLKITKCRPIEYIQRKRIEKAHLLLATSYLSLENIAEQTGINSVSYLSRLFKRYTGLSPSKYRKEKLLLL